MFMTRACESPAASRVCGTTKVRYQYQRDAELIYPFYTKLTLPICKLNVFSQESDVELVKIAESQPKWSLSIIKYTRNATDFGSKFDTTVTENHL